MEGDRRVRRSRASLAAAMSELTLERGYTGLAPAEVAARADVSRSTLYSHFSGLDELLAHSLERHLSTLAQCSLKPDFDHALLSLIKHFWEQRATARSILRGNAATTISRSLTGKLAAGLTELRASRKSRGAMPVALVAAQLSAGQLALLDAWLSGRSAATPEQISRSLHATTYAAALTAI